MITASHHLPVLIGNPNTLNIALTPAQSKWRSVATRLADQVLKPRAEQIDREGRFPRENFVALAQAGLIGLLAPEEFGGPGADIMTTTLVTEALAQGCASTAMCYHMHISAVSLIAALATGEQISQFVLPIARGERLCTYATSEPGSGSRWWHMDSCAVRDDQMYIIDSHKSFVTSAGEADYYVVPTRATAFSHPNELSIFLIEGSSSNITIVGAWDGMGLRGNSSTPIHFDHCRVPGSHRLGPTGYGFPLLMAYALPVFQVGLAAVYLGIAQAAFEAALIHTSKRVHADTGEPLAKVETVQRYIAEMKLRLDQTRLATYRAAQLIDEMNKEYTDLLGAIEDHHFLLTIAETKVIACEMAIDVTNKALQVCGGAAYKRGHVVERCYRDARAGSVMGPSDDALKVMIGQRILGLPFPWE